MADAPLPAKVLRFLEGPTRNAGCSSRKSRAEARGSNRGDQRGRQH
eukprot:gene20674-27465_t